jgi:hypothetical protein
MSTKTNFIFGGPHGFRVAQAQVPLKRGDKAGPNACRLADIPCTNRMFDNLGASGLASGPAVNPDTGPTAALIFAMAYRGDTYVQGALHCYPGAKGIPFSDTGNIVPMTGLLWMPVELVADFQLRMAGKLERDRKRGIIVMLKTERCCTTEFRACTATTAALEKRASPLVADFLIYGAWIKPRDGDNPPGSLKIEQGSEAWKNNAAGCYRFKQGPGATLVFIDPVDASIIGRSDALKLGLTEPELLAKRGHTPKFDTKLKQIRRLLIAPKHILVKPSEPDRPADGHAATGAATAKHVN